MTDCDLLITDARVVDGTGAPWFRGAVGVTGDRITHVTRKDDSDLTAETELDASDSVVAPGFIDTHSHSDLKLFKTPQLAPKLRQGITTEILGQDGFSMAPVTGEEAKANWADNVAGLNGRLSRDWDWANIAGYLDAVAEANPAVNVGTLVGHGTVRYEVMGMANREATDDEIDSMAELVSESLVQGALGFSTGLVYTPHYNATTQEVAALAARLRSSGRPFVAHIRSEGRWLWEALDEFVDIGAEIDVPLHVSHFKGAGQIQQGKADRLLSLVDTARDRGIDLTADQYPYAAGQSPLSAHLPPWAHSEGPTGLLRYLRDKKARERIRKDIEEWRIDGWENYGAQAGWENVTIASVSSEENAHLEGRTVANIASKRDTHPVTVICDLLLAEELEVSVIERGMDETDVRKIMAHPHINVATDGLFGGQPHPRTYGTYPRILETYVRQENHLRLEEAIRKMTSLPASVMGLQSKGVIRKGLDADLVVFDPLTISADATFKSPRQFPTGIQYVLVNGRLAFSDGKITAERPGRILTPVD